MVSDGSKLNKKEIILMFKASIVCQCLDTSVNELKDELKFKKRPKRMCSFSRQNREMVEWDCSAI